MTNEERLIETTKRFICNGLGNSWRLHEIYATVLYRSIAEADLCLARVATSIGEYLGIKRVIDSALIEKDTATVRRLLPVFEKLCDEVGSAACTSVRLEIENIEWEVSEGTREGK